MTNEVNRDEVFLTKEITVKDIYESIQAVQMTQKGQGLQLDGIEEQTNLTNGRVTCLEKRMKIVEDSSIVMFVVKYKKVIWMLIGIGIYIGGDRIARSLLASYIP